MTVDRSRLPALGPDPSIQFPRFGRHRLDNGLDVWTVEHRDLPVLSLGLLLPVGASGDPADRPGLAAFTADMLDEGTRTLDAMALHDRLARMGAQLETEVGSDAQLLSLGTLARFAKESLALLAEIIKQPRFDPEDVRRRRWRNGCSRRGCTDRIRTGTRRSGRKRRSARSKWRNCDNSTNDRGRTRDRY
jgi:zinc protease